MDIVRKLMIHMDKSEGSHYRDELLSKIIEICSQSDYQHITNFEWFVFIYLFIIKKLNRFFFKQVYQYFG
jgi:AP-3 complex subunit delta-1